MNKSFFTENILLKLFALILAVITWYAVRAAISFEMTIEDVPVEVNLPQGWAILNQSDNAVEITVSGSQESLQNLDRNRIKAVVNLTDRHESGAADVKIDNKSVVGIRSGVRIKKVQPDVLQISLGNEVTRRLPVKGKVTGKPLVGNVDDVVCEPPVVTVQGPEQMLDFTEWLVTTPVEVDGRIQTFSKRCKVLPPSSTWTPKIEPSEVMVTVNIVQKSETMEWDNVPVSIMNVPASIIRVNIDPPAVKVRATGSTETLAAMSNVTPRVFVDCDALDMSLIYDLPVKIYIPSKYEVISSADPAFVRVTPGAR